MSSFDPIRFFRLTERQQRDTFLPEDIINVIMNYVVHHHDREAWRSATMSIVRECHRDKQNDYLAFYSTGPCRIGINWRSLSQMLYYPSWVSRHSPICLLIYNFRKKCRHWFRGSTQESLVLVACDHPPLPRHYVSSPIITPTDMS